MATGDPVLSGDEAKAFADALANQSVKDTPDPNASQASPPAGTDADATAGTTQSTPPKTEGEPSGKDVEGDEASDQGPIPYNRFKEVNDRRKAAEEKMAEFEKQADEQAKMMAAQYLQQAAEQHPEINKILYGEQATTQPPETRPEGGGAQPEDPVQAKLLALEKEVAEGQKFRKAYEEEKQLDQLEAKAEAQMAKHKIFEDADARKFGEDLIAQNLLSQPGTPVEKVVDSVAERVRGYAEKLKAQYKESKTQTTRTVPPGAGTGSAAPPGQPDQKLSLDDGSALRALAAAMKGTS